MNQVPRYEDFTLGFTAHLEENDLGARKPLDTSDGKPLVPLQCFAISNGVSFGVLVPAQVAEERRPREAPVTDLNQTVRAPKKLLQPRFEATSRA